MDYKIISTRGHYEVYQNGQFLFSADTYEEAEEDVENMREEDDDYDD